MAYQSVTIFNALYGKDLISAFEVDRGYFKPIAKSTAELVTRDKVHEVYENMMARRKLALILKS